MTKFCVFCGEKPTEKTKEHIIPKWLIEYTGDLKRIIQVGERNFSFDQLTFPACNVCNNEFAELENKTKAVLLKIFNDENINNLEISLLLDWFDKVRIGLWLLSLRMVNHFPEVVGEIEPKFYIKNRMRKLDRILNIQKNNSTRKGINFIGTVSPHFLTTPSCFGLVINNYFFTSISYAFLFNQNLGYPVIKNITFDKHFNFTGTLTKKTNTFKTPLVNSEMIQEGVTFFQPIIPPNVTLQMSSKDKKRLLMTPYHLGIGNIIFFDNKYKILKTMKFTLNSRIKVGNDYEEVIRFYKEISEIQNYMQNNIFMKTKIDVSVDAKSREIMKYNLNEISTFHKSLYKETYKEVISESIKDHLQAIESDKKIDPFVKNENIKIIAEYFARIKMGENVKLDFKKNKKAP
ncbi:hypothetical protein OHV93_17880 [Acinetobacter baumannii]|nr:hypothetical protein [Acinetobacter baumannii]MDC4934275.1 hypothetical protein [Acinetobacter baumannii]